MLKYEDMLWSASGLFRSSDNVSEQEWEKFAKTISIEKKYPGINGIGAIALIHSDEYDNFVALHRQYRPTFNIHPYQERDFYMPMALLHNSLTSKPLILPTQSH